LVAVTYDYKIIYKSKLIVIPDQVAPNHSRRWSIIINQRTGIRLKVNLMRIQLPELHLHSNWPHRKSGLRKEAAKFAYPSTSGRSVYRKRINHGFLFCVGRAFQQPCQMCRCGTRNRACISALLWPHKLNLYKNIKVGGPGPSTG